MRNPYETLGISTNATLEQIETAYNARRTALLEQEEGNPEIAAELQDLEDAYAQVSTLGRFPLARSEPVRPAPDPILSIVNELTAPIDGYPGIESSQTCPYCGYQNPAKAITCLACNKQISRPCPNCGLSLPLGLMVCPRCNTIVREHDIQRLADAEITERRVQEDRVTNQIRVEALEDVHRQRRVFGFLFWILVVVVTIAVCAIGLYALNYFGSQ